MIEAVGKLNLSEVKAFLLGHEEKSQFLIGNLAAHGPILTDHPNSGNFKILRDQGRVVGVFCLSRRGNLLIQSEVEVPELVLDACFAESVPLKGFVGDWNSVNPIFQLLKKQRPHFQASFESKEILYTYELNENDPQLRHDPRVRLLEGSDFSQWYESNMAYSKEVGLPEELNPEKRKIGFESQVSRKAWWGFFRGKN